MVLNYHNARLKGLLPIGFSKNAKPPYPILHFGVGGFHRSHQAWALQQLLNKHPAKFSNWGITGVNVMPQDLAFVKALRAQDGLYFVQRYAPEGTQTTELITTIKEILHVAEDYDTILQRIASPETKIISFTITEGGYNVDLSQNRFIWETSTVQEDLKKQGIPKTVFRILAEGLKLRKEACDEGVVLLSCDNVQHNGDVLRLALLEFLHRYDSSMIDWVQQKAAFIKTMVDRITPVTTPQQKNDLLQQVDIQDNCLVVCEDFFQWVIEEHPALADFPLQEMGATLVDDVAPFEEMKLRLLNGGHSLTGLLGDALGYDRIHTAIKDTGIHSVYMHYCNKEVIPTLSFINGVHYNDYVEQLVARFGNPMINDSTARIISGSTDKLPKFVLPVIWDQLRQNSPQIRIGVFILAAWYYYLDREFKKNQMREVQDQHRDLLMQLFSEPGWEASMFMDRVPMLHSIKDAPIVRELFLQYVNDFLSREARAVIHQLLQQV